VVRSALDGGESGLCGNHAATEDAISNSTAYLRVCFVIFHSSQEDGRKCEKKEHELK
jgi:hypothetical protein